MLPLPALTQAGPSLCDLDMAALEPYQRLHALPEWPQPSAEGSGPSGPHLSQRAVAMVLGSALADAAAMGVHW